MDILSSRCVTYTAVVRYGLRDGNVIPIVYRSVKHRMYRQRCVQSTGRGARAAYYWLGTSTNRIWSAKV